MPEPVPSVTGLVLAGGLSRRFGTDKARFAIDGRPMIARVAEVVRTVCTPVLVGLGVETPPFDLQDVRYVRDAFPAAGPLGGLHAGFAACETPWLLAVACDMPFLTREALLALLDARTETDHIVVARSEDGRLHPLCGCYRRDLLPLVTSLLTSGRRAAHALLDAAGGIRTLVLPTALLANINTPTDLIHAAGPDHSQKT